MPDPTKALIVAFWRWVWLIDERFEVVELYSIFGRETQFGIFYVEVMRGEVARHSAIKAAKAAILPL